ncbi:hypothetical protein [Vibrio europaeus]|uniref:hypothetical protein n=1 Tax=Vibrio europaeus TaxID=300876 RepID=UPI00233ED099|nr:hypothetical protein [Vibrio europaeus]MDC5753601.1 hypothetical protein [Vibrio europaeus]MDC5816486.1 hypothetical protein [Vibrio europaeus]
MNRTICTLSIMNNNAHVLIGRFLNGVLYIKHSYEIRDKVKDNKVIVTRSEQIKEVLAEQSNMGVAVYVDEPVPKFSENHDYTPLIFSENLIIHAALKSYFDLHGSNAIVWAPEARQVSVTSIAQSTIDEKGKPSFTVDAEQMNASAGALLLMCYHAQNCDVSDLSYLRQLNKLRARNLVKQPMFSSKRRRR